MTFTNWRALCQNVLPTDMCFPLILGYNIKISTKTCPLINTTRCFTLSENVFCFGWLPSLLADVANAVFATASPTVILLQVTENLKVVHFHFPES